MDKGHDEYCSACTDVNNAREPLQKAKRESDDSEIVNLKKQKTESDEDEKTSLNMEKDEDEKTALKKVEEYRCLFENEDAYENNPGTIYVKGFDCSLPMADIRKADLSYFCSHRVFAFINILQDEKKALALDGSYLGSLKLEVGKASRIIGSPKYPNFIGCERCVRVQRTRLYQRFIETRGGLIQPRAALLNSMVAKLDQKAEAKKKHCC